MPWIGAYPVFFSGFMGTPDALTSVPARLKSSTVMSVRTSFRTVFSVSHVLDVPVAPGFNFHSISHVLRPSKLQLLISPASTPQQLRQPFRVAPPNPRVDRSRLRHAWCRFQ